MTVFGARAVSPACSATRNLPPESLCGSASELATCRDGIEVRRCPMARKRGTSAIVLWALAAAVVGGCSDGTTSSPSPTTIQPAVQTVAPPEPEEVIVFGGVGSGYSGETRIYEDKKVEHRPK